MYPQVWGEGQPEFESAEVLARREVAEGALSTEQVGAVAWRWCWISDCTPVVAS
jgi:hypothetical protein